MSVYRTLKVRGLNPTKTIADALRSYVATGQLPPLPDTDIADELDAGALVAAEHRGQSCKQLGAVHRSVPQCVVGVLSRKGDGVPLLPKIR